MKTRDHTVSAIAAALFCAVAWLAVWLTAFRPLPAQSIAAPKLPMVSIRPATPAAERPVQEPSRFALPSQQGFSGTFPASRVDVDLDLNPPEQPDLFLARSTGKKTATRPLRYTEPVSLPQSGRLSLPGTERIEPDLQPGTYCFLSPELDLRAPNPVLPPLESNLPDVVRIQLRVDADGSVSQCFFETPVTNRALPTVIRAIRFEPAPQTTDGWIEIRSIPEANN